MNGKSLSILRPLQKLIITANCAAHKLLVPSKLKTVLFCVFYISETNPLTIHRHILRYLQIIKP